MSVDQIVHWESITHVIFYRFLFAATWSRTRFFGVRNASQLDFQWNPTCPRVTFYKKLRWIGAVESDALIWKVQHSYVLWWVKIRKCVRGVFFSRLENCLDGHRTGRAWGSKAKHRAAHGILKWKVQHSHVLCWVKIRKSVRGVIFRCLKSCPCCAQSASQCMSSHGTWGTYTFKKMVSNESL